MYMHNAIHFSAATALIVALATGSPEGLAAPPAHQRSEPVMSIAVNCGDLNLASDAGIRALNERIQRAARRACGVASSTHVADFHEVFADCYQDAVAGALAQVHAAQVAALRDRTSQPGAN